MQYRKILLKQSKKIKSSTKNHLLDELLAIKNITTKKEIDKFLNPSKEDLLSPYLFSDMEKAKKRIEQALEQKQKILIWGDFDCDGVTSSSILYKALKALGADVMVFIPDRLQHGHGLNTKELVKFVSRDKVKLVITVDCASADRSQVSLLKSLNVDTIITDHHTVDTELPPAYAIINPQVKNSIKNDTKIEDITSMSYNSGAVISYKLSSALLEQHIDDDLKNEILVIAAMGAIADVVPILGENRALVHTALELLNSKKEKAHKGIYKLFSKNIQNRPITSTDAAFILAPRINAVGRLSNAKLSFDFLVEQDDNKLDIIIEKLDNYNTIRQAKCTETYEDILEYLKQNQKEKNEPAIILLNENWHIGIIGICASKVVEEFNKPCFLMTVDENNHARCSIRSNDLINVYEVLKQNESLFSGFGGHALAGGCSFDLSKISFDEVKKALLKTISSIQQNDKKENILYADIELKPDDINIEMLETINQLEPFGQCNEPPLCVMFDVNLEEFKLIGKEQNHLRMVFSSQEKKFQAVKWSETEINIPLNSKCDIAFYPRLNTFNDVESVQFEIVDVFSENTTQQNSGLKIYDHRKKTGILDQIASYILKTKCDLGVWAKNPNTKQLLSNYEEIKNNFIDEKNPHKIMMFFDYPANKDDFFEILREIKPEKIHFMNCQLDENLENYIKQLTGMIKYCSNHQNGHIEISKIKQTLTLSESFIQLALEILDNIGSIEILDVDKIRYIKPFSIQEFKNDSMYEVLKDEFNNIIEFKKTFLNCDIQELENTIAQCL